MQKDSLEPYSNRGGGAIPPFFKGDYGIFQMSNMRITFNRQDDSVWGLFRTSFKTCD